MTECVHCKESFEHKDIVYRIDHLGYYNALCPTCRELPVCLSWYEQLQQGLLSDEDIQNWNAIHDF